MRTYFSKIGRYIPSLVWLLPFVTYAYADLPPGNTVSLDDVSGIVNIIARFLIVMSMVLAVMFIVLSGIMTMMAQADPGKFKKGLLRLQHATIGVAIVLATGVIIN